MAKVFGVELSDRKGKYCELSLPATDYELLDALDKLQMTFGGDPRWEIIEHTHFKSLHLFLQDFTLYELNEFSEMLDKMTYTERGAFDGLVQMALNKREGPMSKLDLFTYANSVSCCHVISSATNDAELGRFYAENGFDTAFDDLPDSVFEKLDFGKIGREMREAEDGVFTRFGYVLRDKDLKPYTENIGKPPRTPDYTLSLLVARYPFGNDDEQERSAVLELPTDRTQLTKTLEVIGAASWDEVTFEVLDSATPGYPEELEDSSFEELNEYAQTLKDAQTAGTLTKLKAVLSAKPCSGVSEVIRTAQQHDTFFFEPNLLGLDDVGRQEIRDNMPPNMVDTLLKHVDLYSYGQDIVREYGSKMTAYGLVTPGEGQTLEAAEQNGPQLSM